MSCSKLIAFLFVFVEFSGLGLAQAPSDSILKNNCESTPIRVVDAYLWGEDNTNPEQRKTAGFGDIIVIKVEGLTTLLNRAKCKDTCSDGFSGSQCSPHDIRLFIDGRKIDDLVPESGAPEKSQGTLQFHLERTQKNTETWADLLGSPTIGENFLCKKVSVSVGLDNGYAEKTLVNKFPFKRMRPFWFWVCLIAAIIYFSLLTLLARKYNLLRVRGVDATPIGVKSNLRNLPYSLARFQMAFWFSLVIMSFLFIWLITGAYDTLSTSVLTLIGISAGTSLSAVVIDNSKGQEIVNNTLQKLEEKANIEKEMETSNGKRDLEKQAKLEQLNLEIRANKQKVRPSASKGFFMDILSDVNGISFHRLQMLVWTFVLGFLFVGSVWSKLSMPEFSATILALQGITCGTYLGFKIPEQHSDQAKNQ